MEEEQLNIADGQPAEEVRPALIQADMDDFERDARERSREEARARARQRVAARQGRGTNAPSAGRTPARRGNRRPAGPAPKRYITSIDGLRAFAVIAVMLYHLGFAGAQGGLLGVTVFFVISGYLITGLLTKEFADTGTIKLGSFWLRRIRRLFPAIVTVIVVMLALYTIFSHELLTKMRPDVLPGLFWFENWWYILRDLSYFDALGSPSPLTHFWSLAIEEQFYLVWPIILLTAYKAGADKPLVRRVCLGLAALSALEAAILFNPAGDPSRVYYGTDTRAFSLLIGAWLSYVWPGVELTDQSTRGVSASAVRMLDLAGLIAFLGIVVMCIFCNGMAPFMYYGGLLLCSVLTAVVIAALVHPRSTLARVAEWGPLVYIGKLSYSMYLWHWPIILLLGVWFNIHPGQGYPWWFALLVFALTIAASAASYNLIENPLRKGALSAWVMAVARSEINPIAFIMQHALQAGVIAAVFVVAIVGCIAVPDTYEVPPEAIQSTGDSVDAAMQVEPASTTTTAAQTGYAPLLIGDSVPGDTLTQFEETFPAGLMDSYVGRQPYQAVQVLQGYVDQNAVGHVVVVASFNNGRLDAEELDQMLEAVGPDRVLYLVTVMAPWGEDADNMEPNNALIKDFVAAHENAKLIDWAANCEGHVDEWLYADGEHLRPEAYQIYVDMIKDAIAADMPTTTTTASSADVVPETTTSTNNTTEETTQLSPTPNTLSD